MLCSEFTDSTSFQIGKSPKPQEKCKLSSKISRFILKGILKQFISPDKPGQKLDKNGNVVCHLKLFWKDILNWEKSRSY